MTIRTLETNFDRLSVNDENDPGETGRLYQKTKVCFRKQLQCAAP
jgi:aurora kinase, other